MFIIKKMNAKYKEIEKMKNRVFTALISLFCLCLFVFTASVFAGGAEIKARMKERLPVIKELKAKGIIGEDNKGYLQFIGGNKTKEDVVNAENFDRKKIYTAIAKQQGASFENVGKRRAMTIAEKAKPGEWLQKDNGEWYQK